MTGRRFSLHPEAAKALLDIYDYRIYSSSQDFLRELAIYERDAQQLARRENARRHDRKSRES